MSELADAFLAENKLRLEVIQFLLPMVSISRQEDAEKVKAIEARYGRG